MKRDRLVFVRRFVLAFILPGLACADEAINLGSRRELFVDRFLIDQLKPIFDSLKSWHPDYQRLAKTRNGLGTTFPGFLVLDSFDLPERRRQGNSRRHKRLVRLPQHLTA